MNYIDIVLDRIKYLDELSRQIPTNQGFKVLSRLEEAKAILKLLQAFKNREEV